MIKLIALDLDGTLTNDDKIITPHTIDALMQVQSHGVRLCLASGRPPYGMRPLAQQLRMQDHGGLLLCYNGGHVEDCSTGEVLVEHKLPADSIARLKALQDETGFTLMTYYGEHIYTECPDDQYVQVSVRNNKMSAVKVDDFVDWATDKALNKCLMVGDPERRDEVEERMKQELDIYICHSTPYFIECLPQGIDKGPSLMLLAERIGVKPEEVMAFGDANNDVQMLQMAGVGVAMGNADEGTKAVANFVTLDNNSDGVAWALKQLI